MIIEIILLAYLLFCVFLIFYGIKKGWSHVCEQHRKKEVKDSLKLIKGEKYD